MELVNDETLSGADCWDLLRRASMGRIALSLGALPTIIPVQYFVTNHELAICLGQFAVPDKSVSSAILAFAADSVDSSSRSGWSVQVQGIARLPGGGGVDFDCGQPAAGKMVLLTPSVVTGQRLQLCPFALPTS
jgi:hypothetical protein